MNDPGLSSQVPSIRTPLPGPKARQIIENDECYTSQSYTRAYPLVISRGRGAVVEDSDGNLFLDFTAGIAVTATGHCHPRVVAAIHRQADAFLHMSGTDFYYQSQGALARKLAELAPGDTPKRVFFTNSGAEAVEAAFKLARWHTKRKHVIAFYGAFHGRTMGALSLTASKLTQRRHFSPLIPQVSHVEYPDCYRCPLLPEQGGCCFKTIEQLETLFRTTVSPDEVAAIVVEPIQGEGGYIVPPDDFHPRLKALCEKHGILYVADEVQTGIGRTGKMFAVEHWGIVPDIICLAKGIASGMPLGAIIAPEHVMNWTRGAHASTFGGNPVSCVAALETIALVQEELMANAAAMGELLLERLRALQAELAVIGDVRGKGLMIGVELVHDRQTREPAVAERDALVQACFRRGLLLLGCGQNTVRFCPPLVIDREQAETAVRIFRDALEDVLSEKQRPPSP